MGTLKIGQTIKTRKGDFTIKRSTKKTKELMACKKGKCVHFGDPEMSESPFTSRGDNYCARSSGIKGKNDPFSPNYWSRLNWSCQGKKSEK